MTPTTYKRFADLAPGDRVVSHNGRVRVVKTLPSKGMIRGHLSVQFEAEGHLLDFSECAPDTEILIAEAEAHK